MPHKKWSEIKFKDASPEAVARREASYQAAEAEYKAYRQTLAQVRKARKVSQTELAERLGIHQSQVSRLEKRPDIFLSSLQKYLAAIGAELQIAAVFPGGVGVLLTLEETAGAEDGGSASPEPELVSS